MQPGHISINVCTLQHLDRYIPSFFLSLSLFIIPSLLCVSVCECVCVSVCVWVCIILCYLLFVGGVQATCVTIPDLPLLHSWSSFSLISLNTYIYIFFPFYFSISSVFIRLLFLTLSPLSLFLSFYCHFSLSLFLSFFLSQNSYSAVYRVSRAVSRVISEQFRRGSESSELNQYQRWFIQDRSWLASPVQFSSSLRAVPVPCKNHIPLSAQLTSSSANPEQFPQF